MKAVYIAEPGGPERLIFGDRPDPEAGAGEVVVRVRATSVNHADLALRAGRSATGGCHASSGSTSPERSRGSGPE